MRSLRQRMALARKRSSAAPADTPPPAPIGHNGPPGGFTIDLPLPTSTNRIWRRAHARSTGRTWTYLSKSYQNWKAKADAALKAQFPAKPERIEGPFNVRLIITRAKRFKLDLDNRIKAPMDWAQQAGLIADDKNQNEVVVVWGRAPLGARLTLTPTEPDA